ncbi:MAG: thioredoxin family protein [Gemmatimonadetes bacterium]|nr:thioredoxin family protein [Gemmatimonadota bacterium]MCY3944061.1 thioredoxin family protein [Gemmatimonadota bacterium]
MTRPTLHGERFESALTFPSYLETVERNEGLWRSIYERAQVPAGVVQDGRAVPGRWRLLALSEDWCGDAVNILPVIARLAETLPDVELRVLSRDENPDLMDAHLTDGRSRSIPVVIVYDDRYREFGWWGPRPRELQRWVKADGMQLETGTRYAQVRRFYARDRGRVILAEMVELLRGAAEAAARDGELE